MTALLSIVAGWPLTITPAAAPLTRAAVLDAPFSTEPPAARLMAMPDGSVALIVALLVMVPAAPLTAIPMPSVPVEVMMPGMV